MSKVICVHPYEGFTVGKVYERAEWYVDGNYSILLDSGEKKHVGNGGRIPFAIFKEYGESKKVICVKPDPAFTVGKVYDVITIEKTGHFHVKTDHNNSMYCLPLGHDNSHFEEYVEPSKQTITVDVPEGYKIKSHKVIDNQVIVELEPTQNIVVVSSSDIIIKLKSEHLAKLKQLGVYDSWLSNVKKQFSVSSYRKDTMEADSFNELLQVCSFNWTITPEGHDFWSSIAYTK